jgi:hypothetical protein
MNRLFAWPVGQDRHEYTRAKSLYLSGAIVGGLALGTVIAWLVGVAAAIPNPWLILIALVLFLLATIAEIHGTMAWWPEAKRQVPAQWMAHGAAYAAPRYGLSLGFGIVTFIHHPAFYGLIALLVLNGSMALALVAGLTFGLSRGIQPAVVGWMNRDETRAVDLQRSLRLATFGFPFRALVVAIQVGAAILLVMNQNAPTGGT